MINLTTSSQASAPTPWSVLPGWSLYQFSDASGHKGVRAEPDAYERNLPQEAISAAFEAAMAAK